MIVAASTFVSKPRAATPPSSPSASLKGLGNVAATPSSDQKPASAKTLDPTMAARNWDHYNSFTNVGNSQEEFVKVKTEGGRLLSQSQGLPEGHYDFSRMTRSELNVAINDIILNKRAPDSVINGLTTMLTTMPEESTNMLELASDGIKYETTQNNAQISDLLKAALSYMTAEHTFASIKNDNNMAKATASYQRVASA